MIEDELTDESRVTDEPIRRRPRRRLLTPYSALLLALVLGAAGFYAGVRVEKGKVASTPRTISATAAGGTASASRGGTSGATSGRAGGGFAAARGGSRAAAGGFGGGAGGDAAGGASFGTVASVNGKTLVLTEASGNSVRVKLTSATKISKTESVGRGAVHPGDTVIVSGATSKQGTVSAATITDSGASASRSSASAGSSSSGSGAVGSLFSGGG